VIDVIVDASSVAAAPPEFVPVPAVSPLRWIAATALLLLVVNAAWLSDDSYITLRVVDNLWAGYGLRWNVVERVQVYTHPLWLLLVAAAYGVTREAYWTTIVLSLGLSVAAIALLARRIAAGTPAALAALALAAASKTFVEFSTSGLENPLSHLLLIATLLAAWDAQASGSRDWRVGLLAGLCVVCRMDLVLLAGPILLGRLVPLARARRLGPLISASAAGVAPAAAWFAFAFLYYGSIWPNTAFAKLPPNVPAGELAVQGLHYLRDGAIVDPLTLIVIAAAIGHAWVVRRDRDVALGLLAAMAYVVAVGGDFMTGRFFSAAFVVALASLARQTAWRPRLAAGVAAAAMAIALALPQSPLRLWRQPVADAPIVSHGYGIVDERAIYAPYTGLVPALTRGAHPREHPWARGGRTMGIVPHVATFEAVGLLGYYGGPALHVLDPMALTDPLLARLPADRPWRPGHLRRPVPTGYEATLRSCLAAAFPGNAVGPPAGSCAAAPGFTNALAPAAVADAYRRIALVTQWPVFAPERIRALEHGGLDW
jgi:arabinofuranosyltransferase